MSVLPLQQYRQLTLPLGHRAPQDRRWKTNWPAELEIKDRRTACMVRDISSLGARLWLEQPPAEDEAVLLNIDDIGPIAASVMWRRDNEIGVHFSEEQHWVLRLRLERGAV